MSGRGLPESAGPASGGASSWAIRVFPGGGEPCLRCGVPLPRRRMGCKAGHCPNCRHPYPHGDCSDG